MKKVSKMGIFDFLKRHSKTYQARISLDFSDKKIVQNKWVEIENLLKLGRPSNFQKAVLEADKIVDFVLKKMQFSGETMADRMKSAQNRFSNYQTYQALWDAHKIRNRIVHEMQSEVLNYEAKEAIEKFKKALNNLGAI